jgi:hypothetical protein
MLVTSMECLLEACGDLTLVTGALPYKDGNSHYIFEVTAVCNVAYYLYDKRMKTVPVLCALHANG